MDTGGWNSKREQTSLLAAIPFTGLIWLPLEMGVLTTIRVLTLPGSLIYRSAFSTIIRYLKSINKINQRRSYPANGKHLTA
jgi:hypothetical protein